MIIDTTKTKIAHLVERQTRQDEIDESNRRFARIGLGCFPVMNICPICDETFITSSSLPLHPDQYRVVDDKVVHTKCLAAGENNEENNSRSIKR